MVEGARCLFFKMSTRTYRITAEARKKYSRSVSLPHVGVNHVTDVPGPLQAMLLSIFLASLLVLASRTTHSGAQAQSVGRPRVLLITVTNPNSQMQELDAMETASPISGLFPTICMGCVGYFHAAGCAASSALAERNRNCKYGHNIPQSACALSFSLYLIAGGNNAYNSE